MHSKILKTIPVLGVDQVERIITIHESGKICFTEILDWNFKPENLKRMNFLNPPYWLSWEMKTGIQQYIIKNII